jgi:ribosomal-protein-alanine N-acetyltransferase
LKIRPYSPLDKSDVIELVRENTPRYFAEGEVEDLGNYLDKEREDYFVLEKDGRIIASGGVNYFLEEKMAKISWGVVSPNFHGRNVGTELVNYRLDLLRNTPGVEDVVVRTTQLVYKFYEKMGFTLVNVERDFWANGFDLYEMKMSVSN